MGWLIALAVLVLLLCIPLGISLRYHEAGFQLKILAGWISLPLPQKGKKKEKKKTEKTKGQQKKAQASGTEKPEKKGGSVKDFLPLVNIALELLNDFRRKLRVRNLEMKLILAGDDPCDLAVNYGRAWSALGNLMPLLERVFVIKKRNLEVECDFEASETKILARADLTITLGRILKILLYHGLQAVKAFLNIKKSRKGGASK